MEGIYTSEQELLSCTTNTNSAFPDDPTPSSAVGLFYHHPSPPPTAVIHSPPPPQKLQPIRSNPTAVQPYASDEVASAAALLKIKSEMDADFISSFNAHLSQLSFSLSDDSSDCSGDSAHKGEGPTSDGKPRRKRRRRKLESFLETLMGHVIQKQEQMHLQLMDLIETKEKERLLREQAWRQHELDRARREEEVRSQEAARNLALVAFIRNALGQNNPVQQPMEEDRAIGSQGKADQDTLRRWPTSEVQALITLRAAFDHKFLAQGSKAPVWEEVSAGMVSMGYMRSGKKCREKWENINKYYKKASESGRKRSENAKACPYFHELETLYSNRLITISKATSPISEIAEDDRRR